jgi:hypothetical protein
VFENVFRRVRIEAREPSIAMGLAFFGNSDTGIVPAMLVEQLELFPALITIGNRMLPQPMRCAKLGSLGSLTHPQDQLFACDHSSRCTLTDTALIARTHAMGAVRVLV